MPKHSLLVVLYFSVNVFSLSLASLTPNSVEKVAMMCQPTPGIKIINIIEIRLLMFEGLDYSKGFNLFLVISFMINLDIEYEYATFSIH